ncbi:sensor domain-containing diguanylate cyclase [Atopomonas sediminilitoris]|uniref:sensor domain-containing diguanylate cyclase n=1 Tax=Atopomonas sediminilitoris TaxID=2919919 RepID=UPI001F4E6F5D|nr:diguanylate cyclase [Atopomonas sediminilitoris]MCJ8168103.1 sensor domain-containing diguanylate cyclase [Atopomonas sediminilitoris]
MSRLLSHSITLLMIITALLIGTAAQANTPLVVMAEQAPYRLGEQWQAWEDRSGQMSLTQISQLPDNAWQPVVSEEANFGYTQSAQWLRITLANPLNQGQSWYLRLSNPLLDEVDIFIGQRHFKSGDQRPFHLRPLNHRLIIVPFELFADSQQTLYLRIASQGSLNVATTLLTPKQLIASEQIEVMQHGAFFGAMLIMLLYNALLWGLIRQRIYLSYCLFVFSFTLYQWAQLGFGFQWFWPDALWWQQRSFIILAAIAAYSACLFTWDALQIRSMQSGFRRLGRALMGLCVLSLILAVSVPYQTALLFSFIVVGCCTLGAVLFSITRWLQGYSPARLFALGWGLLVLGSFLHVLSGSGVLPAAAGTLYMQQVGAVIEVLIFGFALAARIRAAEDAEHRAQNRLLAQEQQQREQQTHTLALQRDINAQLEVRVQERTQALETTLKELSSANLRLARLSREDGLTGLYNRPAFNEFLAQFWQQAQRHRTPLCLMIMDLDHFKKINDQFGHLAGDACLKHASELLNNSMRQTDILARYGGEEFIALLPNTTLEAAQSLAERIRHNLENHPCEFEGQRHRMTLSLGLSCITSISEHDSANRLLAQADQALYRAKNAGRNQVACF